MLCESSRCERIYLRLGRGIVVSAIALPVVPAVLRILLPRRRRIVLLAGWRRILIVVVAHGFGVLCCVTNLGKQDESGNTNRKARSEACDVNSALFLGQSDAE